MFTALSLLLKTGVARWWWQIPLVGATVVSIALWDNARISKHVELGKARFATEIRKANEKAVTSAGQARTRSMSGEAGVRDPHTKD